jgi:lysophospholipase L1-like esterase
MKHNKHVILAAFALLAPGLFAQSAGPASTPGGFYLKDGDHVVFYGDSITDQRHYTTFTETFVATRFPAMNVTFTHSGWGGDRVGGGGGGNIDVRLERDVYAYKPTVMTVMLGMNDGGYRAFDQKIYDTYKNGIASIVDKVKGKIPGIRMTLIQPSPYDDITREPKFPDGYNEVLIRYGAAVKEIAAAAGQNTADLNAPLVAVLKKAHAADAANAQKIIGDRVHPGPAGALIMAGALLEAWNAPAIVTDVAIDGAAGKLAAAQNTKVADVTVTGDGPNRRLTWTQLDAALPMPVATNDAVLALAVRSSDFTDKLNRQILRVTGLGASNYELTIDGSSVGAFSAAQFAAGINLAVLDTPMTAQAATVHNFTLQRIATHNIRWRTYQVPYANAAEPIRSAMPGLLKAYDDTDAAFATLRRAAAQPVLRRYELASTEQSGQTVMEPPAGRPNLALNKKWVSSDPNTHGWDRGLTDGVWTGGAPAVYATNEAGEFPKTVTIDLETVHTLGSILIGVPNYGSTKTVAVSISTDGVSFTEIGHRSFSLRKAEKCLFDFKPAPARYVRLTYKGNHTESVNFDRRFGFTTDVQAFAPAP